MTIRANYMNRLSFLDLAFFITESKDSPKHVAGLFLFKRPARSKQTWVKDFFRELVSHEQVKPPFNHVINFTSLGGPSWKQAPSFDIYDHLFYHSSKKVLSQKQLYAKAARLHEPVMARDKPLWECHIIDNVENNCFALYSKIHHSYADGVTISRWMMQTMNPSANDKETKVFWERESMGKQSQKDKADAQQLFKRLAKANRQWMQIVGGISKLVTQMALEKFGLTKNAVAIPFKASEDTPLIGKASASRQCASTHIDMERIARLRKRTRCTLNHIALTCIDGAIRRYLADFKIHLDRPLSIQMPVNLRSENEQSSGNKIGLVAVDLAPETDDPYTRLREIGFTLRAVRNQVDSVPSIAISQYTAVIAVLLELSDLLGLSNYLPAVSDTLVSNVPGPKQSLYMNGAKLLQLLPISALAPGTQMNITLYSYAGDLWFGLIGTKKVKKLDSLAGYIAEAFDELEKSIEVA